MSELGQNLTSSWVRAAGRFGHTPEKPLVMFYVEGDEDVPFWKEIIKPYLAKYDIQVCTNKAVNPDEGNGSLPYVRVSERVIRFREEDIQQFIADRHFGE